MQKIRKIVRANSEKSASLTNGLTDGHQFIGPFPLKKAGDQKTLNIHRIECFLKNNDINAFFHMGTYSINPHGSLFEGGGLFADMKFYMGSYSREVRIRGWGLNPICGGLYILNQSS